MATKTVGFYRVRKWLYLILSIVTYFAPFIIVAGCLLGFTVDTDAGHKCALALAIIALNSLPFVAGLFQKLLAHVPMINWLAVLFLMLYSFFTLDLFRDYVDVFCWIELASFVGSVISTVCWVFYRKYARKLEIGKTNKEMGLLD